MCVTVTGIYLDESEQRICVKKNLYSFQTYETFIKLSGKWVMDNSPHGLGVVWALSGRWEELEWLLGLASMRPNWYKMYGIRGARR